MRGPKALRQQVLTEVRLRRYFWTTAFSLTLLYLLGITLFGDMGILRYMHLNERRAAIQKEFDAVMKQKQAVADRLNSLNSDNFYAEKHARENFGMSGKDEYIFIYK